VPPAFSFGLRFDQGFGRCEPKKKVIRKGAGKCEEKSFVVYAKTKKSFKRKKKFW
jgi:hypothetical protein